MAFISPGVFSLVKAQTKCVSIFPMATGKRMGTFICYPRLSKSGSFKIKTKTIDHSLKKKKKNLDFLSLTLVLTTKSGNQVFSHKVIYIYKSFLCNGTYFICILFCESGHIMSKLNTPAIAGIEYHFYKVLPDNAMLWFFFFN